MLDLAVVNAALEQLAGSNLVTLSDSVDFLVDFGRAMVTLLTSSGEFLGVPPGGDTLNGHRNVGSLLLLGEDGRRAGAVGLAARVRLARSPVVDARHPR